MYRLRRAARFQPQASTLSWGSLIPGSVSNLQPRAPLVSLSSLSLADPMGRSFSTFSLRDNTSSPYSLPSMRSLVLHEKKSDGKSGLEASTEITQPHTYHARLLATKAVDTLSFASVPKQSPPTSKSNPVNASKNKTQMKEDEEDDDEQSTPPPPKPTSPLGPVQSYMEYAPGVCAVVAVSYVATAITPAVGEAFTLAIDAVTGALGGTPSSAIIPADGSPAIKPQSPISTVTVALLLGLTLRNAPLPQRLKTLIYGNPKPLPSSSPAQPSTATPITTPAPVPHRPYYTYLTRGLSLSSLFLRGGIVLLGLRMPVSILVTSGLPTMVMALICVGTAFQTAKYLSRRLGIDRDTGTLIAAGTGICGVTAIAASAPVIQASDKAVAIAVSNVVVFGLMGMLIHPHVAHALFAPYAQPIGFFLGTCIHDTSQVVGGALSYMQSYEAIDAELAKTVNAQNALAITNPKTLAALDVNTLNQNMTALDHATLTKLSRNLWLGALLPTLAVQAAVENRIQRYSAERQGTLKYRSEAEFYEKREEDKLPLQSAFAQLVHHTPTFVYYFVLAMIVRSVGDYAVSGISPDLIDSLSLIAPFISAPLEMLANNWTSFVYSLGSDASSLCLTLAMSGVGLSTAIPSLKEVGWRPFAVGGGAALAISIVGVTLSYLVLMPDQAKQNGHSKLYNWFWMLF